MLWTTIVHLHNSIRKSGVKSPISSSPHRRSHLSMKVAIIDAISKSDCLRAIARHEMKSTSTWFALRNPVFCRLWLASVLSGTVVSAQDMAATWLMHDLGASSFSLSLMATAASAPFFLFTLPAGAVADIVNRRVVIVSAVLWQGACVSAPCFWGVDTT